MLADDSENILELELLQTIRDANPKQAKFYTNMSMDEKGERYYSSRRPDLQALEKAAANVANMRQRARGASGIDSTFLTATEVTVDKSLRDSNTLFPEIRVKPLLKKRHQEREMRTLSHMDPNLLISEQSVTSRYLMRNLYSKGSVPHKEKLFQSIEDMRKIGRKKVNM